MKIRLAAFLLSATAVAASAAGGRAVLPGHVLRLVASSAMLGPAPAGERVDLRLVLRLDDALMARTLDGLYGPGSPKNKAFLTPAQLGAAFGVADKRARVEAFARAAGLRVEPAGGPNDLIVRVSGTVAIVEKAFGVTLRRYRAPDGRLFRANDAEPSVPQSLAPHLQAVLGMSDLHGLMRPRLRRFSPRAKSSSAGVFAHATLSGTGPSCYAGQCGLAPADIKTIYGLTPGKFTGAGQTIAIVEFDGYAPSDLTMYATTFFSALPTTINFVSVDGQPNLCGPSSPPVDPCDWTTLTGGQPDEGGSYDTGMIEVALDADMALALSSGAASIDMYTAPNTSAGNIDVYSRIQTDDAAKVASTSWGQDEASLYAGNSAAMSSENTIFQAMALQGQSIFSAAGDQGAYDGGGVTTLVTDDPASQPYVTGVGGTSLTSSNGTPSGTITEVVWNNGCVSSTGLSEPCSTAGASYSAGGGGVANYIGGSTTYWPIPSYQSGVAGLSSTADRNVPDVALNADPIASPYNICVGGTCNDTTSGSYLTLIGGTSAATPLWAALTNLVNQARVAGGHSTLGFANPPLYQLATGGGSGYANNFNDVTSGNNGYYNAGPGYDNASGWGSFKADNLIASLSTPQSGSIAGFAATTLGSSSISWTWSAAPDTTYNIYYETAPAQPIAQGVQPPWAFTGLTPDATAGVTVYPVVGGIQGTSSVSLTTATLAEAPASTPTIVSYTSSATFTYAACPAPPAAQSCSGYEVVVSSDAGFTGTLYSTATTNPALTSLTITSMPSGVYYAKLAYRNPYGYPSYGAAATFNTNALTPTSPAFSNITTTAITFSWSSGGNPPGENYIAQASTAPDYSGTLYTQSGTALSQTFGALASDTSYYFRVQASGGSFLYAGPQATAAAPPAATSPAFVAVASTTLVAQWSADGNALDAAYEADLSSYTSFAVYTPEFVATTSAAFSGLASNTTYYLRARAFGRDGSPTVFVAVGSTLTLASPPSLAAQPFVAVGTGSLVAAVNASGNPPGTRYVFQISTNSAFTPLTASSTTASATAAFGGLLSNEVYYAQVAALNSSGAETAFSSSASTVTFVAAPSSAAAPSAPSTTTVSLSWSAGGFAAGTLFTASVSLAPSPFSAVASTTTAGSGALISGLSPNTTYYGQVYALSSSLNPNGAPTAIGAASTLAVAPATAAFAQAFVSSVTVAWTAGGSAEGYRVDLSSTPSFATLSASAFASASASSAVITSLFYGTTYYARVGALNWQGLADELVVAGSTVTGAPTLSTGATSGGPIVLFLPLSPPLISLTVTIPAGAFPPGTAASAIEGFFGTPLSSLSGATSNEGTITPTGPQAAFCVSGASTCLSSGGPQPSQPVVFAVAYNPAQLTGGFSESTLQLMRYDPAAGQWTLVDSHDDSTSHVLTAYTTHFSLFAPFFVGAASAGNVSSIQVFPQPWELGAPGSPYYSNVLTFSNLPAGATVKLFTLTGEMVWEGTASPAGTLTWDGHNRFGRWAASGTYLCDMESGGSRKIRRVVLIR